MEKASSILRESQEVQATKETVEAKDSTSQSNKRCPDCGIEETAHRIKGFGRVPDRDMYFPDCDCEKKRWEKEELESKEKAKQSHWENIIPSRFRKCSYENYIPKNKRQEAALSAMKDNSTGSFLLIGAYGSGKTHLLTSQLRQYVFSATNPGVYSFKTTSELIHEIRQHEMGEMNCIPLECVRSGRKMHLFWDDADKIKITDFKLEGLFELIDGLYRHEMKLTMTSNFGLKELQEKLSPAIVRRIDDMCTRIEL